MGLAAGDQSTMEGPHRTRQSSRLTGVGATSRGMSPGISPFGITIPTRQRTRTKTRLRNLKSDAFVFALTKLEVDGKGNEVSIATQKEREVAEALFSLRNVKCIDEFEYVVEDRMTTTPSKRRTQGTKRNTRSTGKRRINTTASKRRMLESEDGSFSSGSYEWIKQRAGSRTRNKVNSVPQKRTIFRLNGRRVYSNGDGFSEQASNGDCPSLKPQNHSLKRQEKTEDSFSLFQGPSNPLSESPGSQRESKNDPVSQMTDEQYFPVAVRDAIKRLYGSTVICTMSEVQSVDDLTPGVLTPLPLMNGDTPANSNTSKAFRTNSKHLQIAQNIQQKLQRLHQDVSHESMHLHRTGGIQDVLNRLPASPEVFQEDSSVQNHQFYPSLPLPMNFSSLSVPLPSLPPSLMRSVHSTGAPMNSLQFPSFSPRPPPLVRASEPREGP